MSDTMEYRGYTGSVEYSAEDNLLFGRLVGIRDRVLFDGEDVKTLRHNFQGAVDEYLSFCEAEGKAPDKPFKGSLNIRIPSALHRQLSLAAEHSHKSLNSVISERLEASLVARKSVGDISAVGARTTNSGQKSKEAAERQNR